MTKKIEEMNPYYKMNLVNVHSKIQSYETQTEEARESQLTSFDLLFGVAVAWAKSYDSVMQDYLHIVKELGKVKS